MDANFKPLATRSTKAWAVFNLIVAVIWFHVGILVVGLALGLDVHPWKAFIPLILLAGSILLGLSGVLLLNTTADGRPRRAAIASLCLAGICGLSYWLTFSYVEKETWSFDLGTLGLLHLPAILALFAFVEVFYLWRPRSNSRPA
jgi:hypothetical protein